VNRVGRARERVAVEHHQVGQQADGDPAGLVGVVDPGGARRVRTERGRQRDPLVGDQRLGLAAGRDRLLLPCAGPDPRERRT
jgi:hypothetical protein